VLNIKTFYVLIQICNAFLYDILRNIYFIYYIETIQYTFMFTQKTMAPDKNDNHILRKHINYKLLYIICLYVRMSSYNMY